VKLSDHPQVTQVVTSAGSTWPDIVFERVLYVETTLALSQKQVGYDYAKLGLLVEAVGKHMEEESAEKALIISADRSWGIELKNPLLSKS
jgi:hypothetical protein